MAELTGNKPNQSRAIIFKMKVIHFLLTYDSSTLVGMASGIEPSFCSRKSKIVYFFRSHRSENYYYHFLTIVEIW